MDWPLVAILCTAALLRVAGITAGFPDINRYFWDSDEGGIVQTIMAFGSGDLNPHSFSQPTFFLYLVFGLYAAFYAAGRILGLFASPDQFAYYYFTTPAPFYLIGRSVSLIAGVLTVWLVYRLAARLFGRAAGLLAALFLAVCGLHVGASQIMKTDATSVLFVVAAAWYCVDLAETGRARAYALAGVFAGLAAGTRYPSGLVVVIIVASHVAVSLRERRRWWTWLVDRRLPVAGVACVATFLVVAPFTVIDWPAFSAQLRTLNTHIGAGGDPLHIGYRPNFWGLHWVQLAEPRAMGAGLVALSALGCAAAVWSRTWKDAMLLALPIFLYWFYSDSLLFLRTIVPSLYLLPAVPLLLVLAARAVVQIGGTGLARRAAVIAAVLAVVPHALATAGQSIQASEASTRVRARQSIEARLPAGTRILVDRAQIPQLSFTEASLARRRSTQAGAYAAVLGESRRTALDADVSGAAALRTKSLTQTGVPYDLFVLLDATEEPLPDTLDFFTRGFRWTAATYGIEYVVVSSHLYGAFLDDPSDEIASEHRRYREYAESLRPVPAAWSARRTFYREVESTCELVIDVRPERLRSAGPRIKVYRVPARMRQPRGSGPA